MLKMALAIAAPTTPSTIFINSPISLFMNRSASQPANPPMMMAAIQPTPSMACLPGKDALSGILQGVEADHKQQNRCNGSRARRESNLVPVDSRTIAIIGIACSFECGVTFRYGGIGGDGDVSPMLIL